MSRNILAQRPHAGILLLVGYLLSTALIGCGQPQTSASTTSGSQGTKGTSPTATPHIDLPALLKLNPQRSEDVSGQVHVQLQGVKVFGNPNTGEIGKVSKPLPGGIDCGSVLVLASSTLSYSTAQITHMRNYVDTNFSNVVTDNDTLGPPEPPDNPDAAPTELRWVQGVPGTTCVGEMEITNISGAPIQILGAGVDLVQTPVVNDFQYHLIEKCSLLGGCTYFPLGGGPACVFNADIQMGLGKTGSTYQGRLTSNGDPDVGPCQTPITLEPKHVVDIVVRFTLTSQATTGMVFQVRPFLSVGTASGTKKVSLPNLASTLVFARRGQYSCYDLHGSTFARDTSIDLSKKFGRTFQQTALCV